VATNDSKAGMAGGNGRAARDGEIDAVSRRLLGAAADVQKLEHDKRRTPRSSGEFHRLADEIAHKAHEVFTLAGDEETLGEQDSPDPRERSERKPGDWADGS
jgi:hypothetical protein